MKKLITLTLLAFVILQTKTYAGETNTNITVYDSVPEIVVTASRMDKPKNEVGASVTVIDEKEINKSGALSVKDLLTKVPGLEVHQSGGINGLAVISLRGSKPGSTLVLLDGIPLNDPMSTDKSCNLALISPDNIERIEVVRGPHSALYGSESMGGVVNLITKKAGKGIHEPKATLEAAYGSFNTMKLSAALQTHSSNHDVSVMVSRTLSEGFSQALYTNTTGEADKDGFNSTTVSSRIEFRPFTASHLIITGRYNALNSALDYGAFRDDTNHIFMDDHAAIRTDWEQAPFEFWNYSLYGSFYHLKRYDIDPPDTAADGAVDSWFQGNEIRAGFLNNFLFGELDRLSVGCDLTLESGSSHYGYYSTFGYYDDSISNRTMTNAALFLQNEVSLFGFIYNTSGVRADMSPEFGPTLSYKTSLLASWTNIGLSLKANAGTGFKKPSLYQYYSTYGSTNLKPEESWGIDAGFVQSLGDILTLEITYFQNDFRNMIDYDSSINRYTNVQKVNTSGFESMLVLKPIPELKLSLDYTYTYAIDLSNSQLLLKSPMHKGGGEISYSILTNLQASLSVRYHGKMFDFPREEMPEYTLTGLSLYYQLENLELTGSVNNLFDVKYQQTRGYTSPGINFNVGLRIKL